MPVKISDLIEEREPDKLAPMILKLLADNPTMAFNVEELIKEFGVSKNAVYQATSGLWNLSLIEKEKRGRMVFFFYKNPEE